VVGRIDAVKPVETIIEETVRDFGTTVAKLRDFAPSVG
jgi:hypothetical protein